MIIKIDARKQAVSEVETLDQVQHESAATRLDDLETPCLILDSDRMDRNIVRLRERLAPLGVSLRPHLKTAKSIEVARRVMATREGPATVSTLREARLFANAGVRDIIYAVGIAPWKLAKVIELRRQGVDLAVVLDTVEQAQAVAATSRETGMAIPALIEIDCDGHRSGVLPNDRDRLVAIGRALIDGGELRGVLTHAGGSYAARGDEALRRCGAAQRKSGMPQSPQPPFCAMRGCPAPSSASVRRRPRIVQRS